MAHCCGGNSETVATNPAEAVTRKREHESFGAAPALLGYGPAANFRIVELCRASAFELGLYALPELASPFGHAGERRVADAQIARADVARMFEIPRTSRDAASAIDHEQMPALMIFGRVVEAVRRQLLAAERTVADVNPAAKTLHFADEPLMAGGIVVDVLKKFRNAGIRGQKNQPLIERCDGSFK